MDTRRWQICFGLCPTPVHRDLFVRQSERYLLFSAQELTVQCRSVNPRQLSTRKVCFEAPSFLHIQKKKKKNLRAISFIRQKLARVQSPGSCCSDSSGWNRSNRSDPIVACCGHRPAGRPAVGCLSIPCDSSSFSRASSGTRRR